MEMGKSLALQITLLALVLSCLGAASTAESDEKVLVEFYSESLCPYCANFFVNYLSKIFTNGIIDLVDLRLIPYGNAHIYNGGEIVCQHGQDECDLNIIQTCAINLYPNVTEWFPFVLCLESLVYDLPRSQVLPNWKKCVEPSGLALEPIETCFQGPVGDKLERAFAAETDKLDPPHKYVPWVVVNGTPLHDDYVDIANVVCQKYKGPLPKPTACSDALLIAHQFKLGVSRQEKMELAVDGQLGHTGL